MVLREMFLEQEGMNDAYLASLIVILPQGLNSNSELYENIL